MWLNNLVRIFLGESINRRARRTSSPMTAVSFMESRLLLDGTAITDPDAFPPGYVVAGEWDRVGSHQMAMDVRQNANGDWEYHNVTIVIRARRVFKTYLGDNNTDNFYIQLKFEVKDSVQAMVDGMPTGPVTVSTYNEYHELPSGIFIRPDVNIYNNGSMIDPDPETFISEYMAGLLEYIEMVVPPPAPPPAPPPMPPMPMFPGM